MDVTNQKDIVKNDRTLLIADFDSCQPVNNIGGAFGGSFVPNDSRPVYDLVECQMAFVEDDALGKRQGHALRLVYDITSNGTQEFVAAFCMSLKRASFNNYNTLNLYFKGDPKIGYTRRVKVVLSDSNEKLAMYVVTGVCESWTKASIPFGSFRPADRLDWGAVEKLCLVFDALNVTPLNGAILIDEITVSRQ